MVSSCGRWVISYNGEVYNFRAIARELEQEGRGTKGRSDTAILLEACATWGVESAVRRCVGMFAFAIWDQKSHYLTLVRDRLGIKPLYWSRQGEVFLFGSELKALTTATPERFEIDPDSLGDYFRFGYVPAPATIYRDVHKLAPGSILTIPPQGKPIIRKFWDIREVARRGQAEPVDTDDPDTQAQLEELLTRAVGDRLVADVPLGAWLSGGVDSSTVVALMQARHDRPVRTFSIGFSEFGYDESESARAIAQHLGTDHHEFRVSPDDALASVPELPEWYDEPFADSSQIPTLLLSKLTRREVTVALSGDGGDEVFGGYVRYGALPRLDRWSSRCPPGLRGIATAALRSLSPGTWDSVGRILPGQCFPPQFGDKLWKVADALETGDLEQSYLQTVSQWQHGSITATTGGNTPRILDPTLTDPVAQLQCADIQTYLPDDILTKVDRASMAASLEVRVPLLDHRLVEFMWRYPRSALFERRRGKAPLRKVLRSFVPDSLVDRPKAGFAVPIDHWLRGPLREWAEDLLSVRALTESGMLLPAPIRSAWESHLSGRENRQHALWTVMMFQSWLRHSR